MRYLLIFSLLFVTGFGFSGAHGNETVSRKEAYWVLSKIGFVDNLNLFFNQLIQSRLEATKRIADEKDLKIPPTYWTSFKPKHKKDLDRLLNTQINTGIASIQKRFSKAEIAELNQLFEKPVMKKLIATGTSSEFRGIIHNLVTTSTKWLSKQAKTDVDAIKKAQGVSN